MQPEVIPESVVSILQRASSPLSLVEIREALVLELGLSPDEAKSVVVASLARALDSHPQVESQIVEAASEKQPGKSRSSANPTRTVKAYRWTGAVPQPEDEQSADEARSQELGSEGASCVVDSVPLDTLIDGLSSDRQSMRALDPLVMITALASASEEQIRNALAVLERAWGIEASLLFLAAPGSPSVRKAISHWARSGGSEEALADMLTWFATGGPSSNQLDSAALVLADVNRKWGRPVAEHFLAGMTSATGRAKASMVSVLARADPAALSEAMGAVNPREVGVALRTEVMGPGKRRLLWAMMQVEPDAVDDAQIWSRVTLADLVEISESARERALLERPFVRDRIVRPLIVQDVRTGSRFAVSRILSYPSAIFRVVSAEQLTEAIQLASQQDGTIKQTLSILRQEPALLNLTAELEAARDDLAALKFERTQLLERLRAGEEVALRWQERAHLAEHEQVTAGTHEIRQAHVDGMKAFAEGLAAVDRLGAEATSEAAWQRLLSVAAGHGISVIGSRGEVVEYDPRLHHPLTDLNEGEHAVVHECGFLLREVTGDTVLVRATVSSEGDRWVETEGEA